MRLKDALGKIDRIYSVLAVSYEFCPWFKAGADYNFIAVKRDEGWEFRNRSNIDLTASYKPAPRWRLSLRERFRITSTNKRSDPALEANPAWIMRSRLMAEYDVRPLPIRPYVYLELSNTLNAPNITGNYIDKIRTSLGVKYALSPRSEFDFSTVSTTTAANVSKRPAPGRRGSLPPARRTITYSVYFTNIVSDPTQGSPSEAAPSIRRKASQHSLRTIPHRPRRPVSPDTPVCGTGGEYRVQRAEGM